MLIDSHQHVLWHKRDMAGLVADMDEHGIDVAWLLSWEIPPSEDNASYHGVCNPTNFRADGTHGGITFGDLVRTRNRYPDRFVLGYCPHPAVGSAPELFESAYHMHRVRVCGEWKFRIPFDDPRSINLFRKAGELKCPVVLHLDVPFLHRDDGPWFQPKWYGGNHANLCRALEACPDTIFLGHAPGFWREMSGDADQLQDTTSMEPVTPGGRLYDMFDRYPNLYADLSAGSALRALSRDPDNARRFILRYPDRLTFARDYYGGDLHAFLDTLDLPADVREKLNWRNALRLVPDTPGQPSGAS
jgi:predicted TIM-barrel fold metal-dependent hydrolase